MISYPSFMMISYLLYDLLHLDGVVADGLELICLPLLDLKRVREGAGICQPSTDSTMLHTYTHDGAP